MLLRFFQDISTFEVSHEYPEGLVIQASNVAGSKAQFRRLAGPESQTPYFLVIPRRADEAVMATDEPMYGIVHMLVNRPSIRVSLHEPDGPGQAWFVLVNSTTRILMPTYDPTWLAEGM